jgi:hypothetical protein
MTSAAAATATACSISSATTFYGDIFPFDLVYQFYTASSSISSRSSKALSDGGCGDDDSSSYYDELWLQEFSRPMPFNRLWTIGAWNHRVALRSSLDLRNELVAQARAGLFRYDVGPILNKNAFATAAGLRANLAPKIGEHDVAFSEFRIDIDASDREYPAFRALCGCKDKQFCERCALLLGFVGTYIEARLKAYCQQYRWQLTRPLLWVASGGRGLHLWSNDAALGRLSSYQRRQVLHYLLDVNAATVPPEHLSILQQAQSRLGTTIPIVPRVDEPVTGDVTHLMRGIFSIHDGTGRIAVPIDSPSQLTATSAPLVEDVVASGIRRHSQSHPSSTATQAQISWTKARDCLIKVLGN